MYVCTYVLLCYIRNMVLHTNALPPPQYPVIESLFEREAKRVVYVDGRVRMRAQEKKEKDEKEASHKQQVSYIYTHSI